MSEVDHPAKRSLFQRLCDAERENAELRATIEAYKAEVEGARNAGLETAAASCEAAEARWRPAGGFRDYAVAAGMCAERIRALKTTPTGGE